MPHHISPREYSQSIEMRFKELGAGMRADTLIGPATAGPPPGDAGHVSSPRRAGYGRRAGRHRGTQRA